MAKKLRRARTPLPRLFAYLLIPWLVMGGASIVLYSAGWQSMSIFAGALGAALVTTYLIRVHETRRLKAQMLKTK
jgi:hypothetical protein